MLRLLIALKWNLVANDISIKGLFQRIAVTTLIEKM